MRVLVATLATIAVLIGATPALAASPHRLADGITDDTGSLAGAALQSSLDNLRAATGASLRVWYTDTLDGADSAAFATATARASDLGPTDLLLVLAVNDRAYGWWKGDAVPVTDAELSRVLSAVMVPALRATDYARAVTATVDELRAGEATGMEPSRPGWLWPALILAAIVLIVLILALLSYVGLLGGEMPTH